MDENRYQIDLLNAINEKLDIECNMYRAVVDTSTSAFLYYSFEEDRFQTLGDWNHYFETAVQSKKDLSLLYQEIDESFLPAIKELFLSIRRKSTAPNRYLKSVIPISGSVAV